MNTGAEQFLWPANCNGYILSPVDSIIVNPTA